MTAATWILMYKKPKDPKASAEALKFFAWGYKNGDKMAEALDYVPMPHKVVNEVEATWKAEIKDGSGKPSTRHVMTRTAGAPTRRRPALSTAAHRAACH